MSIALLAALAVSAATASPAARGVVLNGAVSRLDPLRFGGVTSVLRYTVAEPDRDDTAYLFLTDAGRAGGLPSEAPVLASDGSQVRVRESRGDCTLAHVELRSIAAGQGEIIYAARTFSGDLKTDVNSEPGVMQVSVFRTASASQPGDAAVAFKMVGRPMRSAPACDLKDVLGEMRRLSLVIANPAKASAKP